MSAAWNVTVIVVGVDGSEQSKHAAAVATALARDLSAKLHVVTVVRPPEGWWGIVGSPPTPGAFTKALSEAQQQVLDTIIDHLDLEGIDYQTVEDIGDPGRTLIDYCAREHADLLVVGRRGIGLLERLVMGSVANRVVQDAPCPVLVVP